MIPLWVMMLCVGLARVAGAAQAPVLLSVETVAAMPPVLAIAVLSAQPIVRPARGQRGVAIETVIAARDPLVRRATQFIFAPGVTPNARGIGGVAGCRKNTTRLRKGAQSLRCLLTWVAESGTYQACAHIPGEDQVVCTPFEVR